MKQSIKPFLRTFCISLGKIFWYIFPKKIDKDILFIFKNADMGGAERVQLEILKSVKEFQTFTILSSKSKNKHFRSQYEELSKIWDISRWSHSILGRWCTAGYLQKCIEKADVKIVFGSLSGLFYDIVTSIQQSDTEFIDLFHAFDNNIEFYSLDAVPKLCRRIVIDANAQKKLSELYEKYNYSNYSRRVLLIDNGVKIPAGLPIKKGNGRLNIVFSGRDAPVKRLYLIRKIAQRVPEMSFYLAGIEKSIDDPSNLKALGNLKDMENFYVDADILLLVSEREGFPMVIMEAMANGVVPICTNVGGISTHIKNGVNGFLLEGKDESSIVNDGVRILEALAQDRKQLVEISKVAYEYAQKHFDIVVFNSKYQEMFASYLGENDGS